MNEEEKHICFADSLLKETDIFYKWSEGEIRITSKVLELIVHKSEKKCGRNSLWESGSHKPGRDQVVNNVPVSSKSAKLEGDKFEVSSYRLTKCKTIEDYRNEITKRDETFSKYLVCLTEVIENKHIVRWGFITKDKADTSKIEWDYFYDEEDNKKGLISKDKRFTITYSMSHQLWIKFNLSDLDIICTFEYELNK
jgi:hypothetical protein